MDGHNGLNALIKVPCRKLGFQIDRNQPRLPVMAVNQVRTETYDRKNRQHCFGEKRKFFNICTEIPIGLRPAEINQVVNKIISNPVKLIGHDAYMRSRIVRTCPHIKMCNILEIIPKLIRDTGIVRDHNPDIPLFFVKPFRQRTTHIRQTAGLDKRYTL